jgi:hypothetical protein
VQQLQIQKDAKVNIKAMGKFEKLSESIQKKQGISKERANAITASIGRKKYGKTEFAKMAAAGKTKKK